MLEQNTAKKYLIVIGGATASGKTRLAIDVAQAFKTEILSADSRQFYREMSIGTAKPTQEELSAAPHHFVGNLSIHDYYSVGDFEREAVVVLDKIFEINNVAVMVGGTGLFIRAVCEGLDEFPETPLSIRQYFEDMYEKEGIEPLQKLLQTVDPEYFDSVDQQNPMRLTRALAVWKSSGKPFSSFRTQSKKARNFQPIYIVTDLERSVLYDRINKRVDVMIAGGLEGEVRSLYPFRELNALQTVGYQELFAYFDGTMSREEAIDKIKQHSRNYAKRQTTWFRKETHWVRFNPLDTEGVIGYVKSFFGH
ncbi:MAG: tRNA (adenosine(37)-N6)-dimethylallyltransferase MiaA [Saprospiraceae bacterium]|nr:tRNA (adenosine(37)-N6)-dimethylallyltransferase MiaA [Saprospiraceae bacterium]